MADVTGSINTRQDETPIPDPPEESDAQSGHNSPPNRRRTPHSSDESLRGEELPSPQPEATATTSTWPNDPRIQSSSPEEESPEKEIERIINMDERLEVRGDVEHSSTAPNRASHGEFPNLPPSETAVQELEEDASRRVSVNSLSTLALSPEENVDDWKKKKKVGHYLLERLLGAGSYAEVLVATHLLTKHKVAVKVVSKRSLMVNDSARQHFRREAILLQRLTHPNVVKLYEAMETANGYYLVLELADSGHLLALVSQRGNLTEEESRAFMGQMVSAIDHLHQSDIVHRDIKLENFLLDSNNNIKLVDFGFGAVCQRNELRGQCGCPVYAAPEVFAGRRYGRAVDIWSLGVCFYGMLVGRLPFLPVSNSLAQLFSIILKGCLIPAHLSPSCQNLLSRLLDPQEMRRITAEEILLHHWLTFPDGQPIRRHGPLPHRVQPSAVNQHIVRYMATTFRFSETDIVQSVVDRRLTSAAATYHILKEKRHEAKWRGQTPKSLTRFLEKDKIPGNTVASSSSPAFPTPSAPVNSVTSMGAISTNGKSDAPSKTSSSSPNPSKSTTTSTAYKSFILVLKQSRMAGTGTEPNIYRQPTTNEMLSNAIRKYPPFFSTDATITTTTVITDAVSSAINPTTFRSDTSMTARQFLRINRNKQTALGVTGKMPLLHNRVAGDADAGSGSLVPSSHLKINGHHRRLAPAFGDKVPPPVPPNSSLGILQDDGKFSKQTHHNSGGGSSSSGGSGSGGGGNVMSPPLEINFQRKKNTSVSTRDAVESLRPTLSSLRDSFAGNPGNKSRGHAPWRTRPHVGLLGNRTPKQANGAAPIHVRGKSPPLLAGPRDRGPWFEHMTWTEGYDTRAMTCSNLDNDLVLHGGLTTCLDAVTINDVTERNDSGGGDNDGVPDNVAPTSLSFTANDKMAAKNALTDDLITTFNANGADVDLRDSSHRYPHVPETDSRLYSRQSFDREDFLTPVTRVTITTKGKRS